MKHAPTSVSIVFVQGMVAGILARQEPIETALQHAGISAQLLEQQGAQVSGEQYVALFRQLVDSRADEALGFLSRPLKNGSYALIVRAAQGAATLEQAIKRVANAFGLLQDDLALELHRHNDLATLRLRVLNPALAQPAFLHEMMVRVFWRLLAWFAGGSLHPVRFDFAFAAPAYVAQYGKIFPAECCFSCAHSGFWFDAALLSQRVHWDDAALRAFLADAHGHTILPIRYRGKVSERVRRHLLRTRPQWPDLKDTAAALLLSVPTLQRHLALEGVSFQVLKDELRKDIAITQLDGKNASLDQLAHELGFTDRAAFQRAFKTWTGSAPGAYRSTQRG